MTTVRSAGELRRGLRRAPLEREGEKLVNTGELNDDRRPGPDDEYTETKLKKNVSPVKIMVKCG